jgi:hypothetical protein
MEVIEVYLHSFLTSALDRVSDQSHAETLREKTGRYPLNRLFWFRNSSKNFWRRKISFVLSGIRAPDRSDCSPVTGAPIQMQIPFPYSTVQRLRWSRGSVLAFSTQVCGFKPGRNLRIFKGEKFLSTPSFGGEVKPSVPCRRFAPCKRSLNVAVYAKFTGHDSRPRSSNFRC